MVNASQLTTQGRSLLVESVGCLELLTAGALSHIKPLVDESRRGNGKSECGKCGATQILSKVELLVSKLDGGGVATDCCDWSKSLHWS